MPRETAINDKPDNAGERHCHLMVECMESWFLADRETLKSFFGQGFDDGQLPAKARPFEAIAKLDIYKALERATHNCKTKSQYGKGENSFKLLAEISPEKVAAESTWAARFVAELKKK